jgi:glycerol-3-phosphate acyltransferase PlsX
VILKPAIIRQYNLKGLAIMKIIVDGYGGDNSPDEVIKGCRMAADEYGVEILLTGYENGLREAASKLGISLSGISLLNADSVMTMEDKPRDVIKVKSGSSMAVGLRALADGIGDAFVSAGSTGALVMGSTFIVNVIEGVKRMALAPIMPSDKGCYMMIDGGANLECRPEMLLQFGLMGSVYMDKIMHIKNPRVGLVNVGTEETKGTQLQRDAYALLKDAKCNFIGNIECRDIPAGVCDVAVADGFTGNVILKLTEGVGLTFAGNVKEMFMRNIFTKMAALTLKSGLSTFKKKIDYTEYGGAPLMGSAKPVIKAHGSSNSVAFKNAVRQAVAFVSEGVIDEIKGSLPAAEQI